MPNDATHDKIEDLEVEIQRLSQVIRERDTIIRSTDTHIEAQTVEIDRLQFIIHHYEQAIALLKSKIPSSRPPRAPKKPVGHPESQHQERLKTENEALNPPYAYFGRPPTPPTPLEIPPPHSEGAQENCKALLTRCSCPYCDYRRI